MVIYSNEVCTGTVADAIVACRWSAQMQNAYAHTLFTVHSNYTFSNLILKFYPLDPARLS
jgi:hypothetical protein